jgi:hypothetical protein
VLRDACADARVRDLQQQRPAAAEQQHRLAVDAPRDALRPEQTVIRHALSPHDETGASRHRR